MRIVFLLTQDLQSPSGLGRYWPLAKALVQLDHEVTILAPHSDFSSLAPEEKRSVLDGVSVRYVGQMHVRKVGSAKLYFKPIPLLRITAAATIRLTYYALRTPADAYLVGKPHPMNGLAGLIASRLRRARLLVDCDDYEAASNRFGRGWQRHVVSSFERLLPRLARGVTTNTRFMHRKLLDFGVPKRRIIHLPNGVDRSRFAAAAEADVEALGSQLGLEGRRVILYLGSMSLANHAVDLLLEAFVGVRAALPDAILLLVGGGEDYDTLRASARTLGIEEVSLFVGRVPAVLAPLYYRLAAVSVDPVDRSPAAQARFPLKIVESLVAGTPVVTGDIGDRQEILAGGEAGRLVTPGDPQALAAGIIELVQASDTETRRRTAQRLGSQYYWDRLVLDFLRVCELPK